MQILYKKLLINTHLLDASGFVDVDGVSYFDVKVTVLVTVVVMVGKICEFTVRVIYFLKVQDIS